MHYIERDQKEIEAQTCGCLKDPRLRWIYAGLFINIYSYIFYIILLL
jgi:hypothetical protein